MEGKFVMVTTDKRGVFAGTLKSHERGETCDRVVLTDAHMCVHWPSSNRGVLGLAKDGPDKHAKITPGVEEIELTGVHSVTACTEVAEAAWKEEPWGN